MLETWEYFIYVANVIDAPGIIIDLRTNGGGFSFIGQRMAGYFFDEELIAGYDDNYNREIDAFFYDELRPDLIVPPEDESLIYNGPVAVLVGPGCASACEFFAYSLTLENRAAVVGQYPTNGIGGGYYLTAMPEGVLFALPTNRPLGPDGEIIIEGIGVQPDVDVPVTEETVFSENDVVLDAAVEYLVEEGEIPTLNRGEIEVGGEIEGSIKPNQRIRYTLDLEEGDVISIYLEGVAGLDTVLRLYSVAGVLLAENDDAPGTLSSALVGLEVPFDLTIIVEVATYRDEGEGDFILSVEVN
jgi:hypothetical protein